MSGTETTETVERRLRAALAQRADRTEPADEALDRIVAASCAAEQGARRRRSIGVAAAAAAVLAVIAVAVLVSRPGPETIDTTDDPARTTTSPSTTIAPDDEEEDAVASTTSTTVPSPTTTEPPASTTTSPPATTTPATTTAPPAVLPGASTDPVNGTGTQDGIAHIADVRVGSGDGYDRVVIELLDGPVPDWSVRFVDPPITQDGSGETVAVGGEAFLLVTLTPATAYTVEGETVVPTYLGPGRLPGPGSPVVEVVRVGDYEAYSTWAIGLSTRSPFRVTTLSAPTRLVIDIAT